MKRISDKDWNKIEYYADLFQMCVVDQRNKDTNGDSTNILIKQTTKGIVPLPHNLNQNCLRVLTNIFSKIDGNKQLGNVFSSKVKKDIQ